MGPNTRVWDEAAVADWLEARPGLAAPSGECSNPQLAARFAAVYARWREQHTKDVASQKLFEERVTAVTGVAKENQPTDQDESPEAEKYRATRRELAHSGSSDKESPWTELNNDIYSVVDVVLAAPVESLADLGLHVRAVALANQEYWTEKLEIKECPELRRFVDTVCRFCGFDPLPGVEIVPLVDAVQS